MATEAELTQHYYQQMQDPLYENHTQASFQKQNLNAAGDRVAENNVRRSWNHDKRAACCALVKYFVLALLAIFYFVFDGIATKDSTSTKTSIESLHWGTMPVPYFSFAPAGGDLCHLLAPFPHWGLSVYGAYAGVDSTSHSFDNDSASHVNLELFEQWDYNKSATDWTILYLSGWASTLLVPPFDAQMSGRDEISVDFQSFGGYQPQNCSNAAARYDLVASLENISVFQTCYGVYWNIHHPDNLKRHVDYGYDITSSPDFFSFVATANKIALSATHVMDEGQEDTYYLQSRVLSTQYDPSYTFWPDIGNPHGDRWCFKYANHLSFTWNAGATLTTISTYYDTSLLDVLSQMALVSKFHRSRCKFLWDILV